AIAFQHQLLGHTIEIAAIVAVDVADADGHGRRSARPPATVARAYNMRELYHPANEIFFFSKGWRA
ncbi:hypothetical protein AB4144_63655, partial [Rhizobiaceae sp. 2RAB30]